MFGSFFEIQKNIGSLIIVVFFAYNIYKKFLGFGVIFGAFRIEVVDEIVFRIQIVDNSVMFCWLVEWQF